MTGETIHLQEFERFAASAKATERRLSAENTWLRHHYTELEAKVAQLRKDISTLKSATTRLKKTLGPAPTQERKTRSKK